MNPDAGRSIVDVVKDIAGNVQHLIRSEVRLAKTEIRDEAIKAKAGVIVIGAGGVLGVLGLFFVLFAAMSALAIVMPVWAAALIVAAVTAAVGGLLIASGISQLKRVALAPRTVASLQENLRWMKTDAK